VATKKNKPWRQRRPPGKISRDQLQQKASGRRLNKTQQARFEKAKPYCIYTDRERFWGKAELVCFKTKAAAQKEKVYLEKANRIKQAAAVANCDSIDKQVSRWRRAAAELRITSKQPKSLQSGVRDLQGELQKAMAKHVKGAAACRAALKQPWNKPDVYTIKQYQKGPKTKSAWKRPAASWWTPAKAAAKEAARKAEQDAKAAVKAAKAAKVAEKAAQAAVRRTQ
jgi:hypothetical protein